MNWSQNTLLVHCEKTVQEKGANEREKFLLEQDYYWQTTLAIGGKYHCTAVLLFDWSGFDQTCKSVSSQHKARSDVARTMHQPGLFC